MSSVLNQDFHVNGHLTAKTFKAPAGSITNAAIAEAAGIDADKLEHQYESLFTQVHGSAATAERRVIHTVKGATGEIVSFRCGNVVACTVDATITIDLLVNGSSVLNATVVLDSTNTAYTFESGTVDTPDLTQDDVVEVSVTVAAGAGVLGQGLFCEAIIREDAQ